MDKSVEDGLAARGGGNREQPQVRRAELMTSGFQHQRQFTRLGHVRRDVHLKEPGSARRVHNMVRARKVTQAQD
jgi:hypothetical protein